MQSYKESSEYARLAKRILSDILGFLKDKVDNDALTLEEQAALLRFFEENIPVRGTIEDLARYYHQSPVNVRSVIHRRLLSKPLRRFLYSFLDFRKVIPDKWVE